MKSHIKRFLPGGNLYRIIMEPDEPGNEQAQYKSIFIISTVLMIATSITTVMNWFNGTQGMFISTAILSVTFFTTNIMIYKRVSLRLISTVICLVLGVLFSLYVVVGGNEGFAITWVFLLPCSISLLFGMRAGLMISGFFMLLFCVSFYTPIHNYFLYEYSTITLTRFPILYGCFFLINTVIQVQLKNLRMKQIETQHSVEAAARAKSDFLAKMSHEIRTPMNAVMGLSELVLRKELPQDVYENVLMIRSASTNLLSIINDILDFSKIESGKLEILENDYQFPSLMNDVINIIRVRLADKPVQFAVNIDPSIPMLLTGDETRIRQVLINLLSNALKYTHKGHISFTVTGAEIEGNSIMLKIVIADTGVGIKDEDMGKLFGDFVQIDTEKNKGIEGTGLGLAIARGLCRSMGGDITVSSEYGKGSEFTISLTQKIRDANPFAAVNEPHNKSVLLYEPRNVYQDSIMHALDDLGVRYRCVGSITALLDQADGYAFVFVSSLLYSEISPGLARMENPPKLVLLADISETLAPKDARTLNLPAHSLSIANILNDVVEDHGRMLSSGITFTAHDAKVLLVDDITANLKVAEGLMMPYEMQVTLCTNGREAVELISRNRYDVVFMDHMMPDMDGLEATKIIRGMEGDYYQSLPIIALTANAVSGMKEMYIENGMNDFLTKPIETVKLNAILERWIPKEMRRSVKVAETDEEESAFVDAARTIPELSVQKAVSVSGGSVTVYERTLKLSASLLPDNIAKLDEYINGDISRYRIEVHGVKGVLNNMGAYGLGDMAYKLELYAGDGDIDACREGHPVLKDKLIEFSNKMNALLGQFESSDKEQGDIAAFTQVFPEIESAVDFFDSVHALSVLEPLLEYTYGDEIDQIVSELSTALQHFDFDVAEESLAQLREKTAV